MNARWHEMHPLGRGASLAERVKWHVAHQKACACRDMPASVRAELERSGAAAKSKAKPAKPRAARARTAAVRTKADPPPLDPRFAAVVRALRAEPGVTFGGKGFGSSALKFDDKIFAMWTSKDAFVVKLDKVRVGALVEQGKGRYFDPGRGRLMKEWLEVGAPTASWVPLAKEALAFGRGR
jgi:hypothetical protein